MLAQADVPPATAACIAEALEDLRADQRFEGELHLNFGEEDSGSPIEFVRYGLEKIRSAYASQGAEGQFSHFIEAGVGHVLSEAMWARTRDVFARHLRERG